MLRLLFSLRWQTSKNENSWGTCHPLKSWTVFCEPYPTSFPGSLFFPFSGVGGERKKRDPGKDVEPYHSWGPWQICQFRGYHVTSTCSSTGQSLFDFWLFLQGWLIHHKTSRQACHVLLWGIDQTNTHKEFHSLLFTNTERDFEISVHLFSYCLRLFKNKSKQ